MAKAVAVLALLLLAAAMGGAGVASAQQCNAGELAVCAPAIIGGAAPTAPCCASLRSQEPCFCQYAHNPAYGRYINSPAARAALTSCGITIPSC
ncbi:hypothetical protein SEVIR_9G198900v4 [Setaria viridis]|uniref:Bifunctional inhibitor/plant lipid transfer protein/seed storage helical domain-containing protein n=1 Tax=Setaria viridis TaxID=4556 RepID=A0A4U6SY11_SETVI|nr:non-specific lipid-transfer protein 2P-like [Setaria viridis]TKV93008.1 hypothetical protein SEVIR_9G198900v2 [Setaria viridis]